MGSKQRKPRPPRTVRRRAGRVGGIAAGPAASGPGTVDEAQRRGNQAAGADLIGRTLVEDPAFDARHGPGLDGETDAAGDHAAASHGPEASSYGEIWTEVQDMIVHGAFSFRQLVGIIADQPELTPDERVRMQEAARRQLHGERPAD